MNSGPWIARDDEEFERRIAQERASARDLCLALHWHHVSIMEILTVVDDDGNAERMTDVRRVLVALDRAREVLATYYHLPPTTAIADVLYAQGEPPRLHTRAVAPLQTVAREPRDTSQERQREAPQQTMVLLNSDDRAAHAQPTRQPQLSLIARLFEHGRRLRTAALRRWLADDPAS